MPLGVTQLQAVGRVVVPLVQNERITLYAQGLTENTITYNMALPGSNDSCNNWLPMVWDIKVTAITFGSCPCLVSSAISRLKPR